jgi:hypothetical protein
LSWRDNHNRGAWWPAFFVVGQPIPYLALQEDSLETHQWSAP